MSESFKGAKLAILVGDAVVSILRDDIPTIPWPGYWDLPGGGREGDETGEETVLREVREELGLVIDPARLIHKAAYETNGNAVLFFATEWPEFDPGAVRFGDEGQRWRLYPLADFMADDEVIPLFKPRLQRCLDQRPHLYRTGARP